MGQHCKEADRRTDGSRESCSERAHITGKYKEIIAEYIENSSGKYGSCRQRRVLVVSQICRQHLVEQEKRNCELDRKHIFSGQCKGIVLRAKYNQQFPVKKDNNKPDDHSQYN